MATGSAWTPHEIATLERLRAEGQSMTYIARQLGRTRNAVCGMAHRMKLPIATRNKPLRLVSQRKQRQMRAPSAPRAPKFRPAPPPKAERKPPHFTDDPASRLAAYYFAASDEAQRRRDGYRERPR